MEKYIMSEEEQAYLAGYDISAFDRPSVAADMAVFSIMEEEKQANSKERRNPSNYRKDPLKKLKILLIRRASFPYKNAWALPGGFCRKGESVSETARRELCEETGVSDAYLRPFDIFSEEGRDPRGWIISHAFLALINGENTVSMKVLMHGRLVGSKLKLKAVRQTAKSQTSRHRLNAFTHCA